MRSVLFVVGAVVLMALAFWAYRENYHTQTAINEMNRLQRDITSLREDLRILNAEWAYLNRPKRLRQLVDLSFERLRLVPLEAKQFATIGNIAYAARPENLVYLSRRTVDPGAPTAPQDVPQPEGQP